MIIHCLGGSLSTTASNNFVPVSSAQFNIPTRIFGDTSGNFYICDKGIRFFPLSFGADVLIRQLQSLLCFLRNCTIKSRDWQWKWNLFWGVFSGYFCILKRS